MSRFTKLAATIAVLTIFSSGLLPTQAQADTEQGPQYAPTMLILDASGSMQRPDRAGTMMDAAKNAVHTFVSAAPAESKVGLTVYGTGTGNTEAEKSAGCRDVQVLRKPDAIDKAALNTAVDGIKASGWTPMGNALRQAAASLPSSGPRSVVLVSDGDDTCAPPDPCDVARELKQQGVDIVMHTIGFAVDALSRAQLTCVAQATGGTYTDAPDGSALERILPRVSAAALRNYASAGTPIIGTPKYADAPMARPGQHLDTIGQKETKYYAVKVPDGATAYFSGTVSFPRIPHVSSARDMNTLELRVYGENGRDCNAFEFEQVTSSSDGAALTVAKRWDGATQRRNGDSGADACKGGGTYYFAVKWNTVSAGVPERLPIELLVGIEPAATDLGPAAVLPATTFAAPTGSPMPVTGGGSFNVATTLGGSGSYADTLQRGEYVFYRVKLDWGQGLAYRVNFEANSEHGVDNISNIATKFYSPIREEIGSDFAAYTGSAATLPNSKPAASVPIRYLNRNATDLEQRKQGLAGWYYIAVKLGSTINDVQSSPVPIRIDLTVTGTPETGPRYATRVADGIFGENASKWDADGPSHDTRKAGAPTVDATKTPNDDGSAGISTGIRLAIVAGVVVVAAVVGTGLVIRRRRR